MDANNHERFLEHLDKSDHGVFLIARYLATRGYSVRLPPCKRSKTHDQWKEHADNGDLFVEIRIEVKHCNYEFTCASDYPFQHFIICAKHAWDRAQPKPRAIYIISKDGKYAGIVKADIANQWWSEHRTDKRYRDYSQEFYFCDVGLVQFIKL